VVPPVLGEWLTEKLKRITRLTTDGGDKFATERS
jgi:hypothetical protein